MLISKQEFSQNTQANLAQTEPVFITEQGQIVKVMLSYEEYQNLKKPSSKNKTLLNCFAAGNPEVADVELEIPPRSKLQRPSVDFD
jgi:hypothetical protein